MSCCDWKRNETFEKICEKYSNFLSYHSVDINIFDRYAPSTKNATHRNGSETFSERVETKNNNPCTSDRSSFFSNYVNKANFVKFLAEKLQKNGFNVIQCPVDADTTIIKTALTVAKEKRNKEENVTDIDILNALENHVIKYLLFAHAFTGCDTTSAIHNFGKTSIFKKLKDSVALTNIGDVFYEKFKMPEEIDNACINFFEKMYTRFFL